MSQERVIIKGQRLRQGLGSLHWVILLVSTSLTIFAYLFSKGQVEEKLENRFDYQAEQIIELISERMEKYEEGLLGGVGAIQVHGGSVTREEWLRFSQTLSLDVKYPGVNGIGVIVHVPRAEKEAHLAQQRGTLPEYRIHPTHTQEELYPIVYIEPVDDNQAAVGLDMAFERSRYSALMTARDTGAVQITAPISLVQDDSRTPGFLFFSPYYRSLFPKDLEARRSEFLGAVYAPFIVRRLMEGLLAKESRQIGIKITDGDTIIFDEHLAAEADFDPMPLFTREVDLPLYGRVWSLDLRTALSFRAASDRTQPVAVLLVGLFIDALLLGVFILLTRGNRKLALEVDERRRAQELLQDARYGLEERVAQRTLELERSNRDLQSFVYAASHDLRSPLRGIDNLSQWIAEDYEAELGEEGQKQFALLRGRIARMDALLNALLAYNKIGRMQRESAPTSLLELLGNILEDLEIPAGFEIRTPEEDIIVHVSPSELSLVLQNLLQNALKHHDRPEGRVDVDAHLADGILHLKVSDDGPGIPPELVDKAFGIFQTLTRRDKQEGSGIGLSLVKKQVEFVGGVVSLVSEGRGTTIRITWPLKGGGRSD